MTLDDLIQLYHTASRASADWSDYGLPDERAGVAAVVRALLEVIDLAYSDGRASKVRGDNENAQRRWVDALINEILNPPTGGEAVGSATAQRKENDDELRRSVRIDEERLPNGPRGLEREGDVGLDAGSGTARPALSGDEDRERRTRAVGGLSDRPAGGRLDGGQMSDTKELIKQLRVARVDSVALRDEAADALEAMVAKMEAKDE